MAAVSRRPVQLKPLQGISPRIATPQAQGPNLGYGHWVTVPDGGVMCVDYVEIPASSRPFTAGIDVAASFTSPEAPAVPSRPSTVPRRPLGRLTPRDNPLKAAVAASTATSGHDGQPSPVIVEANTSVSVTGAQGTTEQVLPHTWIILDSSTTVEAAGDRLSREAGGGELVDVRPGVLHRVDPSRLTEGAAEANFQRAARGLSMIALRHAAHILLYCGGKHRAETPSAPLPPPQSQALTSREVAERFRRMKCLVEFRAAAASQRQDISVMSSKSSTAVPSAAGEAPAQQRTMMQKGLQALADFIAFANHKFGNPVRAWFMLDPEGKMSIGEKQFARACVEIGFKGNTGALWRYLDSDRSGRVTILELDPHSAMLLADFKEIIHKDFTGSLEDMFSSLDSNKDGRVNRREFVEGMRRFGFRAASSSRLFFMMDRELCGFLLRENFAFLGHWDPPAYMSSRADAEGLEQLKQVLKATYRLLLRAWRKILDKDGAMRVSWDDFREACKALWVKTTTNNLPRTEREVASIWRALDQDCSGWISLAHFDMESYTAVREFKKWSEEKYGTVVSAFRHLSGRNWKVTNEDLIKADCYGNVATPNSELLLRGLNVHDNANIQVKTMPNGSTQRVEIPYLVESDVRFLDRWDLAFEEKETKMRQPAH
mmetsp:Transcript_63527/g.151496  ORF Transcript_63527/g.151496 Transcript_63527/m.151496 type:complete len:658 (-) Transcript_63527:151-2124(-)